MTYLRFKYLVRPLFTTYPATVPMVDRPSDSATKGPPLPLDNFWLDFVRLINTPRANQYVLGWKSGWVNNWKDNYTPLAECLTMGGNIALADDYVNKFYKVHTLFPMSLYPDTGDRLLVHKFTCLNRLGQPCPPGDGTFDVYYPFVTKQDAWIHESKVEVFETMPETKFPTSVAPVQGGYLAVVLRGAIVRQQPTSDSGKVRVVAVDETDIVQEEIRSWAKIGERRYVSMTYVRKI